MVRIRTLHVVCAFVSAACASDSGSGDGTEGGASSSAAAESSSSTAPASTSESSGESSDGAVDSSSTGEPFVPIDCTEACADTMSDAGVMLCYSCRCKGAFDNWLPTPEEVQCSTATDIVTPLTTVNIDWGPMNRITARYRPSIEKITREALIATRK